MKRIIFIIGCWVLALVSINAQSLEQKKICALKWTLQQTFYNKTEGQQIAHLNVSEFKTLNEFQKNKLISDALKKVSDKTDLNRIKNIQTATAESDITSYVPTGGRKEYLADVEKIKSQNPTSGEEETAESTSEVKDDKKKVETQAPEIRTVEAQRAEEAKAAEASAVVDVTDDGGIAEGMSFLEVILSAAGLYIVLTACLLLFLRSRRSTQKHDEMVSMEQYRAERVRLMERIKAVEIEMENIKSLKPETKVASKPVTPVQPVTEKPVQQPAPVQPTPAPVKPEQKPEHKPEPETHTLFTDPNYVVPETDEDPAAQTNRPKSSAVMFYPVPVDGVFVNGSNEIEVGKSLYMMKTSDDKNATFQILNTPEAIASALVSMNETVKPACKILNTVAAPVEILAEKLGTAEREGDGWRITNKAVVRLI